MRTVVVIWIMVRAAHPTNKPVTPREANSLRFEGNARPTFVEETNWARAQLLLTHKEDGDRQEVFSFVFDNH
jgi:hypothetical protein